MQDFVHGLLHLLRLEISRPKWEGPLETEVGSLEQVLNLAKTACDRQDGSLCIILNSSMKPHMQPRRSHRLS